MGLLETVIGSLVGGNANSSSSPLGGILTTILGGGPGGGFGGGGASAPGTGDGLGGLLSQLQQAGLGNIVQSWVGTGPNQPISPDQLQNALGEQRVQDMAHQAGLPTHDLLSQLSQHLPRAVDGMTPDGHLPDEGSVSV